MISCAGAGLEPAQITQYWTVGPVGWPKAGICRVCRDEYTINKIGVIRTHKNKRLKPWTATN